METVRTNIMKKIVLVHLMVITEELIIMELDSLVAKIRDKCETPVRLASFSQAFLYERRFAGSSSSVATRSCCRAWMLLSYVSCAACP